MMMLKPGDCRYVMAELATTGAQFDSVVTDPPYHLTGTVKRFGGATATPGAAGFMGKQWDGGDIAFQPDMWRAAYDLLKPGGYLLAFGGSRTFHRITCAIEDAGFEIRDSVCWLYGNGFPKSHDVSKGIDRHLGAERTEVVGVHERDNLRAGGAGFYALGEGERGDIRITAPATPEAAAWAGWGTALKPAWEPIIVARKPLIGTIGANVLAHGVGGLNIDATRVPLDKPQDNSLHISGSPNSAGAAIYGGRFSNGNVSIGKTDIGRWPANVVHDGSPDVLDAFAACGYRGAAGTAARFFYSAKATADDRCGSGHPTVKPLALLRWLCRMVTPPGGHILDPFAGSGTTLQAGAECGFSVTGIERETEYQADILRRIAAVETREYLDLFSGIGA